MDSTKTQQTKTVRKFCNGLSGGLIGTFLFHPLDKSLYLMVKNQTSLFNKSIWTSPYKGITQNLFSRSISHGFYFAFYDIFRDDCKFGILTSSILTGSTVAVISNPITVLRMYNWNHSESFGYRQLYKKHGLPIFNRGIMYTLNRDIFFSIMFYTLVERYNKDRKLSYDFAIASSATFMTSPIHYFRSRLYFDFNKPVKFTTILKEIKTDLMANTSLKHKLIDLFHTKFNAGFFSLRVGMGVAISKKIYEFITNINY